MQQADSREGEIYFAVEEATGVLPCWGEDRDIKDERQPQKGVVIRAHWASVPSGVWRTRKERAPP